MMLLQIREGISDTLAIDLLSGQCNEQLINV